MADTPEVICNSALQLLGITNGRISDLTTDTSKQAVVCRDFYASTRDATLRAFPWTFAKKRAELTSAIATAYDEWDYGFALPADCLAVRRVLNGVSRIESLGHRIAYEQIYDSVAAATVILVDFAEIVVEYTAKITDTTKFTPDFDQALIAYLASKISASFGLEAAKLGDRAYQMYRLELSAARENAARDDQLNERASYGDSDFIRARE